MRRLLLFLMVLFLAVLPAYADEFAPIVKVCTITFTSITTPGQNATSCTGTCATENTRCAVDISGADHIQVEYEPTSTTYSSTDWDLDAWVSDSPTGLFKRYQAIITDGDAMTSIGGAADTQYDVTKQSANIERFTFDGTGTDPTISATNPNMGELVCTSGFTQSTNNGCFAVITSTTNYFEVYNPTGVNNLNSTNVVITESAVAASVAGSTTVVPGPKYMILKLGENSTGTVNLKATVTVTR